MATYTRLGSYLLAGELTADPIGRVHRGISIVGSAFDHHWLVRTFSEELLQAGIGSKLGEASKVLPQLSGSKAFGQGYRIESGASPHVACDYVPGRTLAQMIEKAKVEQIPLGVDHALSVLQGITQGVVQLHTKGLSHGLLSPHSVWVSFEGATEVLDAPYAQAIRQALPKSPVTKGSLEAYMRDMGGNALHQDFFSLGAMLYELLTFDRLPVMGDAGLVANKAMLKAAQEDTAVPPEILSLLKRLVGADQPFESVQAFNTEMDHVLYDGDYSPTTFNMAFFMHTLFREENDRDGAAIKTEQAENYAAYSSEADSIHASRPHSEVSESEAADSTRVSKKKLFVGMGMAAALIAVLGFFALRPKGDSDEVIRMRGELAKLQAAQAEQQMKLAGEEQATQDRLTKLKEAQSQTKSAAENAKLDAQIKEEEKKSQILQQQKADLKKAQEDAQAQARKIATNNVATAPPRVEPPKPEPPKVETPKPPPPQETPKVEAPKFEPPKPAPQQEMPRPTPAIQQPPSAAPTVVQETTASVLQRAQAIPPARARTMRFESDKPHTVVVRVFVDAQGRAQKVNVISGVPGAWGFDEAAVDAASRSTYRAATLDGKPVSGFTIINYVFAPLSGRR